MKADTKLNQPRTTRFVLVSGAQALALAAVTLAGCAVSNYDFDALSEKSGYARASRLADDLALAKEGGKDEDLYDVGMIPLARTRLSVFAEAEEEGIPDGFVETDIHAYLPLFGFVDGTVSRYDVHRRQYERHDFNSYLWGLIQSHREQVDTKGGLRVKRSRRFLWFFGWSSSPEYVQAVSPTKH